MKQTQHLQELRQLELPELDARLKEVRTELFNLRFQAATGQLDNHRQIRSVRRQIAAVLTVMQGRRLGIEELVTADPDLAVPGRPAAATAVAEAGESADEDTDDEDVAVDEAAVEDAPVDDAAPAEAAEPEPADTAADAEEEGR